MRAEAAVDQVPATAGGSVTETNSGPVAETSLNPEVASLVTSPQPLGILKRGAAGCLR